MGEDHWIWLKRWLKFHVRLLGRHFHILRWTECSASCEGGTQSRLFGFPDSLGLVARSKTWSHHCLFCNIFVDAQRDPVLQDAAGMWICAFILFWSVRFCKKLKVSRLPRARNRDKLSIWTILELWDDSVSFMIPFACLRIFRFSSLPQHRGVEWTPLQSMEGRGQPQIIGDFEAKSKSSYFRYVRFFSACQCMSVHDISLPHLQQGHCLLVWLRDIERRRSD
jgi:hypothetical protein